MKKILHLFLIGCLLISNFFVSSVKAKTLGDLKNELKTFEKNYNENQQQKALSEAEMNKVKGNINSINNSITKIVDDVDNLNNEIYELNNKIEKNEAETKEILSFTQVEGGESAYLQYAFGAKSFTDFIYRIAVSEQLTVYNKKIIEESIDNIAKNNKKTEELKNKRVELATKQENLKGELEKIKEEINEFDHLSLSIKDQIKAKKEEISVYEKNGCKDNQDITVCASKILPPDTSFWRPMTTGSISGVLGLYGNRVSPTTGKYSMHWGMDFSTSGANAGNVKTYSIAAGRVVSVTSTYGSCGGKRVYIQHYVNGKVYMSGYLHLNKLFVNTNDIVTKDTAIGTLAGWPDPEYGYSDGCSKGAHLHLEFSTGTFANKNYESNRISASNYINFPPVNVIWKDRTTRY